MENTTISRSTLEWMLKAVEEAHQRLVEVNKRMDKAFDTRDENFDPYTHIGSLSAQLGIAEVELNSILKVTKGE
jgi:hypothetical protein